MSEIQAACSGDKLARTDAADRLCDAIIAGTMLTDIALEWDVSLSRLRRWIAADPTRSARVREARQLSAMIFDEKAERALAESDSEFALKRAKELAHHYRWRAAKIDDKQYGEKVELNGNIDFTEAKPAELVQRVSALSPLIGRLAERALGMSANDQEAQDAAAAG